jgi:hypothetical protein
LEVKESYEGTGRRKTTGNIKRDWRGTGKRQERRYKKGISN